MPTNRTKAELELMYQEMCLANLDEVNKRFLGDLEARKQAIDVRAAHETIMSSTPANSFIWATSLILRHYSHRYIGAALTV